MLNVGRIVCPTDFSEGSFAALSTACNLAEHFEAELILIHIVPLTAPFSGDLASVAVPGPSDQERIAAAQRKMTEVIDARVPSQLDVAVEVRMGDVENEIVATAEDLGAELIVIATHGVTGWRHLAFGSTAEAILRRSKIPVLTVRAPEKS